MLVCLGDEEEKAQSISRKKKAAIAEQFSGSKLPTV